MIGTIVNSLAIILGSIAGCFIKGGLKIKYKDMLNSSLGLSVVFIGLSTAIGGMLDDRAETVLYVVSIAAGSVLGEFIDIEGKIEKAAEFFEKKLGSESGNMSQGFVTGSLTFCMGTMGIIGAIESGIQGVYTTLFAKAVLDGVISVVLASSLGAGVAFSAFAVLLYQGLITIMASFIQPYITGEMLVEISIVGGIMIAAIGINMLEIKKFRVGNMLPSIIIPVLYYSPPVKKITDFIVYYFN